MAVRLVSALAALAAATGCTGRPVRSDTPPPRLVASVTQFRYDEGTSRLHAGVTNASGRPVRITSARMLWDGFAWPLVRLPGAPVPPGQTAAFVVRHGAARCAGRPGAPYLRAVVDGQPVRLQLEVDMPGLLPRLRAQACAGRRLAAVADVSLRLGRHTARRDGYEYLPGSVVLRRRAADVGSPVTVTDLGGSVLFDLLPRDGPRSLPATLPPTAGLRRLPVLVRSADRCDGHARGNSSQTFLFSVYTRLGGGPAHRTTYLLGRRTRTMLLDLLDRECGASGPAA